MKEAQRKNEVAPQQFYGRVVTRSKQWR